MLIRITHSSLAALAISCLFMAGCGGGASDTPDGGQQAVPSSAVSDAGSVGNETATSDTDGAGSSSEAAVETDDAEAVAALEKLASEVKRDGDGFVSEVSFRDTQIDNSALAHLTGLPRLRSVLLNATPVTDDGLAALSGINTLTNIDLRDCAVSNAGLKHLESLTGLRALRLSGSNGACTVDDDGLDVVAKMPHMKALFLDHLRVSEIGLAKLAGLTQLEELYMAKTLVGDEAMELLTQFPALKKVRVSQTHVSADGVKALSGISTIEELDISENSLIYDDAMEHLARMTQLTRLNLWRVGITDAGAEHLAPLTSLQWLNVDNTQISDEGLVYFKDLKKLTFLHLGSTFVTDDGMVHLEGLTSLKDLKVTRTGVTEAGVAKLKEKLPNTEIQLEYIAGE